jgi:DNA repair protein RadC
VTQSTTPRRRKSSSPPTAPRALFVPLGVADHDASYRQASDEEILASARALLARRVRRGISFTSPNVVKEYLLHTYSNLDHEVFVMIALDNRHRLIAIAPLFRGTIDGSAVYPREVVKEALRLEAAAVCFAHSHPSGHPEPSHADELVTARLKEALALVDVRVIDHVVIAGDTVVSFAERGLI